MSPGDAAPSLRAGGPLRLLDEAARLLRERSRIIFVGTAAVLIPLAVLNVVTTGVAYRRFEEVSGIARWPTVVLGAPPAATGFDTVRSYLSVGIGSLATALVGAWCALAVVDDRYGNERGLRALSGVWVRRWPRLIGLWIVTHVVIVTVALTIIGVVAAAAFVMLFSIAVPVMMIEGLGPFATIVRSWRLVRRRFFETAIFVIASTFVTVWIRFSLMWMPQLAESTGLVTFGGAEEVVGSTFAQLATIATVPYTGAAASLWYLDLRVRTEGIDLVTRTGQAFPVARG
jgi:hypothetical protein